MENVKFYYKNSTESNIGDTKRNMMGDSLLDGRQRHIFLKGAGIQKSCRTMTPP